MKTAVTVVLAWAQRSRRVLLTFLAVFLAALSVSGCGDLVGAIVGPREVVDPFSLGGSSLHLTTAPLAASPDTDQPTASGTGNASQHFADVTIQRLPLGLRVTSFRNDFSILPLLSATRPDAGYPDTFTLDDPLLRVTLSDSLGDFTADSGPFGDPLTFNLVAGCAATAPRCDYSLVSDPNRARFLLAIRGADRIDEVLARLETGGDNLLTATLTLHARSTPTLAGSTLTVSLRSLTPTVRIGF